MLSSSDETLVSLHLHGHVRLPFIIFSISVNTCSSWRFIVSVSVLYFVDESWLNETQFLETGEKIAALVNIVLSSWRTCMSGSCLYRVRARLNNCNSSLRGLTCTMILSMWALQ